MSDYRIRAHHGMCLAFFEGKGCSPEFTENMTAVIGKLNSGGTFIRLTAGADIICRCCPHNIGGICESIENVERYDNAVLRLCGLKNGEEISWQDFRRAVFDNIISAGKTAEVCGGCSWSYICAHKAALISGY